MKGNFENYYRIRSGKIRILFELIDEEIKVITIVYDVDFRGDVYKLGFTSHCSDTHQDLDLESMQEDKKVRCAFE